MLRAINDARAKARSCGSVASPAVAAVAWNDTLFAVAAEHSQDMAERNYFAHDTPEGVNPFQRMDNAGYKHGAAGENIAAGQVGIASVMTAWLSSPGHCQGIMSGDFTQMAVGCVLNAKSTPYWTMDMASPR